MVCVHVCVCKKEAYFPLKYPNLLICKIESSSGNPSVYRIQQCYLLFLHLMTYLTFTVTTSLTLSKGFCTNILKGAALPVGQKISFCSFHTPYSSDCCFQQSQLCYGVLSDVG